MSGMGADPGMTADRLIPLPFDDQEMTEGEVSSSLEVYEQAVKSGYFEKPIDG